MVWQRSKRLGGIRVQAGPTSLVQVKGNQKSIFCLDTLSRILRWDPQTCNDSPHVWAFVRLKPSECFAASWHVLVLFDLPSLLCCLVVLFHVFQQQQKPQYQSELMDQYFVLSILIIQLNELRIYLIYVVIHLVLICKN